MATQVFIGNQHQQSNYDRFYNIIDKNYNKSFKVFYKNGDVEVKRLFISTIASICEFAPKSRKKGTQINIENIVDIQPIEINKVDLCRKNLSLIIKYTKKSGLWCDLTKSAERYLSLTDDELSKLQNYQNFVDFNKDSKFDFFYQDIDCFFNLFTKKIKTISINKEEKEYISNRITDAIKNGLEYKNKWNSGYDCYVTIHPIDEETSCRRAWYNEYFKNIYNGHEYYLLDEKHVLYSCKD